MSISSKTVLFLTILCVCSCLRFHEQVSFSHLGSFSHAQSSDAQQKVQSELSTIDLQISAVNNTIANNLYIPYEDDGRIVLRNATPQDKGKSELCVVLNESQSSDVASYIAQIEQKLQNISQTLNNVPSSSRRNLESKVSEYGPKIESLKYLVQNPCKGAPTSQSLDFIGNSSRIQGN